MKVKKILRVLRALFFGDIILMYVPFWLREEYFREIESNPKPETDDTERR